MINIADIDVVVKTIFSAPLSNLFIIVGLGFLTIAVLGNIRGKIEPGPRGRLIAGAFGLVFIFAGLIPTIERKWRESKCDEYANKAVNEYNDNLKLGCNFNEVLHLCL
jgi:hypothetical protein